MAFAPLASVACSSFGQGAAEMLHYRWIVGDRAAKRAVSLPDFSSPATAAFLVSLTAVTGTPHCQNFTNAAVGGPIAHRFRRSWWLFSKALASGYSVRPLPPSPIPSTLNFFAATGTPFRGSLILFMPPTIRAPLRPRSGPKQAVGRELDLSSFLRFSVPSILCPLLLLARTPPPPPGGASAAR